MRERHINRFLAALSDVHGICEINGQPARIVVEALASMTEQSAYTWFGQEALNTTPIGAEAGAEVISRIWYDSIFRPSKVK